MSDFLRLSGETYCLMDNQGYRLSEISAMPTRLIPSEDGKAICEMTITVTFKADGRTDQQFSIVLESEESLEKLKECNGMNPVEFFVRVWKCSSRHTYYRGDK